MHFHWVIFHYNSYELTGMLFGRHSLSVHISDTSFSRNSPWGDGHGRNFPGYPIQTHLPSMSHHPHIFLGPLFNIFPHFPIPGWCLFSTHCFLLPHFCIFPLPTYNQYPFHMNKPVLSHSYTYQRTLTQTTIHFHSCSPVYVEYIYLNPTSFLVYHKFYIPSTM